MDSKLHRKRKLGVFGPRNSGKTTYWACLYGSNGSVSFTHEQTQKQLDALWQPLCVGKVAPATPQGEPQDIVFSLHSDGTTWCVSTKDYSGSLVELSSHGQGDADASHDLRHSIKSWVQDCDAMLVLVPADLVAGQDEKAYGEFRHAMEALLEPFRNSKHPGPLPVCLAVTKSDLLPGEPAISTPSGTESQPALPERLDKLAQNVRDQFGKNHVGFFRTSAFGGHAPGDRTRPPKTGPRPQGLEEPLKWALAESDRCLSAPVIKKAQRSLERRWFHGYSKAIKACDRVAARGLPEKEDQKLEELKAQLVEGRQKQRWRRVIAGAFMAVLLTVAGLWLHAYRLATKAQAAMSAGSMAPDSIASVRDFVESTNPACFVMYADERKRAQDWYDERAQGQVTRIHNTLAQNADVPELNWRKRVERARLRAEACLGFAEYFPNRVERLDFDEEASRAQALIEELQAYGPFDDNYANVIRSLEAASVSEARELVRNFRDSFLPEKYPLRTDAFQRLDSVVDSKAEGEEQARLVAWEARIRADYGKDPSLRSRHLEEIEKWLAAYQASGLQELEPLESGLEDLRRGISEDWDRESYRKLETAAGRMFEGEDKLKEAIQYGDEYLQANRDMVAMKGYVRDWLLYARALQATRRIGTTLKDADLEDSDFEDLGNEELRFVVEAKASRDGEWEHWQEKQFDEDWSTERPVGLQARFTVPLVVARVRITITEFDPEWWDDEGHLEVELLKFLEKHQAVGSDKAEAQIDVDGAKVTVVISDLPKRRKLPPYEKPQ